MRATGYRERPVARKARYYRHIARVAATGGTLEALRAGTKTATCPSSNTITTPTATQGKGILSRSK